MEIKIQYSGMVDRQIKVAENESKGLRMLYDNFDNPEWKHGDPIVGTMTFTDVVEPSLPITNPLKARWNLATTTVQRLNILAEALGLND